ncbi:MAG TPA: polymer-forming cytoskeletal protein [Steroidobacteraceae bacterium]|nr:polymer-forming cytoskeletal protein [Steroidobacteraceae bacterium]
MFNRNSKRARIDTLIGQATRLEGDLTFAGGLHLDGRVAGNVRADPAVGSSLSVSETGTIDGDVEVPSVMLNGTVTGDIVARERVVLGPHAKVQGNVLYGVIEMASGAQILGKLSRVGTEAAPASPPSGQTKSV